MELDPVKFSTWPAMFHHISTVAQARARFPYEYLSVSCATGVPWPDPRHPDSPSMTTETHGRKGDTFILFCQGPL